MNAEPLERMSVMKRECCGKVACIRIERQGEFELNPDLFRIQTRLPLRPSTNMSHTTYVKHTGYQVNIIHHEVMFQVTINDIVQYICQCRIRPPNRAGGNATRHGTDANSGDGWVGSLLTALPSELGPKVEPAQSAFEQRVRTPMLAPPYRP